VQRAELLGGGGALVSRVGGGPRAFRQHLDVAVEFRIEALDARQVQLDELA
jgi:hypothetical protein